MNLETENSSDAPKIIDEPIFLSEGAEEDIESQKLIVFTKRLPRENHFNANSLLGTMDVI